VEKPQQMVPCTAAVMQQMTIRAMEIMLECRLMEIGKDDDETADNAMAVLRAQGHIGADDNIKMGQCLLLPPRESGISLLLVSPCPADGYDDDLRLKPSPVRFERTAEGEIMLPARWFITKIDALAENPAADAALQTMALQLSRRAECPDVMVLPFEMPTVALLVNNADGTQTIYEALPGGTVLHLKITTPEEG
jgi:hypothetical protein